VYSMLSLHQVRASNVVLRLYKKFTRNEGGA